MTFVRVNVKLISVKEFNQIVPNSNFKEDKKYTSVYGVRFWTIAEATSHGFAELFGPEDDQTKKYAMAVVSLTPDTYTNAALIDVNKERFDESAAYRAGVMERILSIYGEPLSQTARKQLLKVRLAEEIMNLTQKI